MNDPLIEDQFEFATGELSGDGLPRDGHGRYILPHPVTGEKKGRTRVTTMASMGDSGRGLAIYRERTVVAGMGYRPDLCARAAAAHSGLETDPNAKKLLSEIAEAAYIQAGGTAGANLGTAQHAVFEQHLLHGVPLEKLAEYFHADIKAIIAALEFHQLRILPQYIERVVYSILYDRGGRIDAIVEHIPTGDLYIFDVKTEEDPVGHPEGKTIQLAYYGNADCMFNYETGQWEPMPNVRTDVALIVNIRPGKGAETDISKAILTVPIDQGWVGVRTVEMMRSWRQQKLCIAPFISQANWQPPAPVNRNGDVAIANAIISGNTTVKVSTTTLNDAPDNPGTLHNVAYPTAGIDESVLPATAGGVAPTPNGVRAQVSALVDQAMASGQQLNTEQVAELNKQAAQMVVNNDRPRNLQEAGLGNPPTEPQGQSVVGPGTPHTIHSGINAQVSSEDRPEGVPDTRPPAPKSALGKMSAMEHLKQLLDIPPYIEGTNGSPGQGVSPDAEVMELAQLPKPRLQELIHYASGQQIPMESKDLKTHKKPLAEMLIPLLDQQRRMKAGVPAQDPQPQFAPQEQPTTNGFIDMSYEGVINAITNARSVDQLTAVYQQVTGTYGPNGWIADFNTAANNVHAQLTSN